MDGRRRRSKESRARIVRAVLELIRSGNATPSAEAVAARADIGLRTVFRHFDNMESLYREIGAQMLAELLPIAEKPFAPGDLKRLLAEMTQRRIRIFERIMPIKIAADARRAQSPYLAEQAAFFTRQQRLALHRVVPKEKQNDAVFFESLDLVLSFDTWRRLRKDQELSLSRAKRVLQHLIGALLAAG